MKINWTVLTGLIIGCANCDAQVYSGLNGQTLDGICLAPTPIYNLQIQNSSDSGSPMAVVQNGPEFTANFVDMFGRDWQVTADFTDNYQIIFNFSASNPSANLSGGQLIQWHFYGFNFNVLNLKPVGFPFDYNPTVPSYDQNDIWIGFTAMGDYAPYNTLTFQITPSPEPRTVELLAVGAAMAGVAARLYCRTAKLVAL